MSNLIIFQLLLIRMKISHSIFHYFRERILMNVNKKYSFTTIRIHEVESAIFATSNFTLEMRNRNFFSFFNL